MTDTEASSPERGADFAAAAPSDASPDAFGLAALEALHESEFRLQLFVTHVPAAVAMFDMQMRYVAVSRRWLKDYRLGERNVIGRSHYEIFPEISPQWREVHRRAMVGEVISNDEDRFDRVDGSTQWLRWEVRPWHGRSAQIGGIVLFTEDITARKQAEETIRRLNDELSATLHAIPDLLFDLDRHGTYCAVWTQNPELLVRQKELLLGRTVAEMLPPVAAATVMAAIAEAERDGSSFGKTIQFEVGAGVRWFELSASRKAMGTEPVGRYILVARDITQRRQAEDQLRGSEERLRLAMAAAGQGSWHWDMVADTLIWSDACRNMFGLPAGTLASYDQFLGALHPQDRELADTAVQRAIADGTDYAVEFRSLWADGSVHWISSRGRAFYDDTGRPLRMEGVVTDITERKRLDLELERYRHRLRELVDTRTNELAVANRELAARSAQVASLYDRAPCGYHSLSPEGIFLSVNDTELGLLGYERHEVVGHHMTEFMTPQSGAEFALRFAEYSRTGRVRDLEFDVVRKDGVVVPVLVSADQIRNAEGEFQFNSATMIDNRERKRAAMQLDALNAELARRVEAAEAANNELVIANQELDAFAYAVSHDLRAPLRAMSGFSQVLVEDYADRLDEDALRCLQQITTASVKMGALIDGILALARSTRGDLHLGKVDISALAMRLLDDLARGEPGRVVERIVEPGLSVIGDARMIESVMGNLLSNAWKYTGKTPGPAVRVHAGDVGGVHGICVTDNGAGFDTSYAGRLFKPFQRLHRQDEFPGLGIGLATVQRIVRRHGGDIRADGRPGAGATFCFRLPDRAVVSGP